MGTLANLGATALGAVVIAVVIAPSQEVPLVAGRLSTPWLLVLLAASLLLSYIIVFVADFISVEARASHPGILRHPVLRNSRCTVRLPGHVGGDAPALSTS